MIHLRWAGATLLAFALSTAGCYTPNISPGGFACGDAGACPDNFQCNTVNNRCYQGPYDASLVCTSVTTAAQICSAEHAAGQVCNPGCQTGCGDCGWCGVVAGATKCLTGTAGTKDVGTICDPTMQSPSECKTGLYCQPECGTGRCYRFCDSSDTAVCGTGSSCNVNPKANGGGLLPASIDKLCSLVESCDPIAQTGCVTPFACYPTTTTNVNECDCPGTVGTGTACGFIAQCIPADSCFGPPGSGNTCLPICIPPGNCASGTTCMNPAGAMYGYCM